jgi:putative lipoprotein
MKMKRKRLGRLGAGCILLALAGCATVPVAQDPWLGPDKAKHFGISAVLAGATTAVAVNNGLSDGEACGVGARADVRRRAGKETYDARIKKTFWSWRDLAWGLIGGLAGSGAVLLAK